MANDSVRTGTARELPQNYGLIRKAASIAELQPIVLPPFPDDYILVETKAVALNPTDWTTLAAAGAPGTLMGCDYAGLVIAIGPKVTKAFRVGDRVCGISHGANDKLPWDGAFARFVAAKGDIQMKIPSGISWEEACTVGVGVLTAGLALWKSLELHIPTLEKTAWNANEEHEWILIYGGSTAAGSIAIQFAKLSGYHVITTASPRNFEMLKKRGADIVLDHTSANIGTQIYKTTKGSVHKVLDCVGTALTASICADALGSGPGLYCSLLMDKCRRQDVESRFFLGYSVTGESYIFENEYYEAQPELFEFGKACYKLAEELWFSGRWQAHPRRVESGGLLGVTNGLKMMEEGKVSGFKFVYNVDETAWPRDA